MFEQLFTRPGTIERYQTAPLAVDRLKYLIHCAQSGVGPNMLRKIAVSQLHLVHLLNLKEDEEVRVSRVEAAAREWSRPRVRRYNRPASLKATAEFAGRSARWLRFLGRLEEPKKVRHPHSAEVAAYAAWMRGERGLSEVTIRGCCIAADEFFDWLARLRQLGPLADDNLLIFRDRLPKSRHYTERLGAARRGVKTAASARAASAMPSRADAGAVRGPCSAGYGAPAPSGARRRSARGGRPSGWRRTSRRWREG